MGRQRSRRLRARCYLTTALSCQQKHTGRMFHLIELRQGVRATRPGSKADGLRVHHSLAAADHKLSRNSIAARTTAQFPPNPIAPAGAARMLEATGGARLWARR